MFTPDRRCTAHDLARAAGRKEGKDPRIERRLASIGLVFAVTAVMLLSVVADAAIAITGKYASSRLVGGEVLWHAIQLLVSTLY